MKGSWALGRYFSVLLAWLMWVTIGGCSSSGASCTPAAECLSRGRQLQGTEAQAYVERACALGSLDGCRMEYQAAEGRFGAYPGGSYRQEFAQAGLHYSAALFTQIQQAGPSAPELGELQQLCSRWQREDPLRVPGQRNRPLPICASAIQMFAAHALSAVMPDIERIRDSALHSESFRAIRQSLEEMSQRLVRTAMEAGLTEVPPTVREQFHQIIQPLQAEWARLLLREGSDSQDRAVMLSTNPDLQDLQQVLLERATGFMQESEAYLQTFPTGADSDRIRALRAAIEPDLQQARERQRQIQAVQEARRRQIRECSGRCGIDGQVCVNSCYGNPSCLQGCMSARDRCAADCETRVSPSSVPAVITPLGETVQQAPPDRHSTRRHHRRTR